MKLAIIILFLIPNTQLHKHSFLVVFKENVTKEYIEKEFSVPVLKLERAYPPPQIVDKVELISKRLNLYLIVIRTPLSEKAIIDKYKKHPKVKIIEINTIIKIID